MHNLRFALRALRKSPGFTLVAVLTIAVGIGANTALFSIFNQLVLHPIDLPDAGRLVRVWTNNTERNIVAPIMSVPKYEMFREARSSRLSGFAGLDFHIPTSCRAPTPSPEQLTSLNVLLSWVSSSIGLSSSRAGEISHVRARTGRARRARRDPQL